VSPIEKLNQTKQFARPFHPSDLGARHHRWVSFSADDSACCGAAITPIILNIA
jgi:hypothetical protein